MSGVTPAVVVGVLQLGALLEQQYRDRDAARVGGGVERREAAGVPGVHVGAAGEQHLGHLTPAGEGGRDQRRLRVPPALVDFGAVGQQAFGRREVACARRVVELASDNRAAAPSATTTTKRSRDIDRLRPEADQRIIDGLAAEGCR